MIDPTAEASWHPASWLSRTAGQIPSYRDQQRADEVMAELLGEHVALKKSLGEI